MSASSRQLKELENSIISLRGELSDCFNRYNKATGHLRRAVKDYIDAENTHKIKDTVRSEKKLNAAGSHVDYNLLRCNEILQDLMYIYRTALEKYDELIQANFESPRRFANVNKARGEFVERFEKLLASANRDLGVFVPDENGSTTYDSLDYRVERASYERSVPERQKPEYRPAAPTPSVAPVAPAAAVSPVTVAPVTIDVTPMVERAINATMDKLILDMEKKLAGFIENLSVPVPSAASAPETNEAPTEAAKLTAELSENIAAEELHVFEKLKELCASLDTLTQELGAISDTCFAIAERQKEVAEKQKDTSALQRTTLRDQQGLQVSSRVVAQDQTELAALQLALAGEQKTAVAAHEAAVEALRTVAESQTAVAEAQAALENKAKEISDSQRELVSLQQTIIRSSTRVQELHGMIAKKQSEIAESQKELLASQRKALKEQRALSERAGISSKRKSSEAPDEPSEES